MNWRKILFTAAMCVCISCAAAILLNSGKIQADEHKPVKECASCKHDVEQCSCMNGKKCAKCKCETKKYTCPEHGGGYEEAGKCPEAECGKKMKVLKKEEFSCLQCGKSFDKEGKCPDCNMKLINSKKCEGGCESEYERKKKQPAGGRSGGGSGC